MGVMEGVHHEPTPGVGILYKLQIHVKSISMSMVNQLIIHNLIVFNTSLQ